MARCEPGWKESEPPSPIVTAMDVVVAGIWVLAVWI